MKAKHELLRRLLAAPLGAIVVAAGGTATVWDPPRQAPRTQARTAARSGSNTTGAAKPKRQARPPRGGTDPGSGAQPATSAPRPMTRPEPATTPTVPAATTTTSTTTTTAPPVHDEVDPPAAPTRPSPAPEPLPAPEKHPEHPSHSHEDSVPVPETAPAVEAPTTAPPEAPPAEVTTEPAVAPESRAGAGDEVVSGGADLAGVFGVLPATPDAQPAATAGAIADAFSTSRRAHVENRAPTRLIAVSELAPPPTGTDVAVATAIAGAFAAAPDVAEPEPGISLVHLFDAI